MLHSLFSRSIHRNSRHTEEKPSFISCAGVLFPESANLDQARAGIGAPPAGSAFALIIKNPSAIGIFTHLYPAGVVVTDQIGKRHHYPIGK